MQTPKARASSSGTTTPQKNNSPRSSEASQKNNTTPPSKLAISTSEVAQKVSPRVVRQLKTGPRYSDHTASSANLATKPPKERSPKVADQKPPNSPASEKKRSTRVSELENQISQLENDLKLLKDQLRSTEELKEQAEKEAEQSRQQLSALQNQFSDKQETHTSVQTEPEPESEPEAHPENQENELNKLKQNLSETLALVEDMKVQLTDSKASESRAHSLAQETLTQLEAAKKTVDTLKSDGLRAAEAHDALARELESSRARISFLEAELLKSDEAAEKAKSEWAQREAELESELRKSRYEVEELRANLMDKETELQGIWEENEGLSVRLESSVSGQGLTELRRSLDRSRGEAEELRARLAEKEAEFRAMLEVKEKEENNVVEEIEAVRTAERAAAEVARAEMEAEVRRMKVQTEQWRKAAEAAAAMISAGNNNNINNYNNNNNDNGQVMERTGSMDSHYGSPRIGKVGSPYVDDLDDDLVKKKNGNKTRRFGSLWKKQQK